MKHDKKTLVCELSDIKHINMHWDQRRGQEKTKIRFFQEHFLNIDISLNIP